MTTRITQDDSRASIAKKLGARVTRKDLRSSRSRESRLEQSSQRRTRNWDLRLELQSLDPQAGDPPAYVDQNLGSPKVVVTDYELPQPVSDIDWKSWDYAAQRALTWHEDGHVLFTDHEDFKNRLKNLNQGQKGTAKQIWNALEDGAIEKALSMRWNNAYDVLRLLRANLFAGDPEVGFQDPSTGGYVVPMAHAIHAVCLETWMHDVYGFDPLLRDSLTDRDGEYHFSNKDERVRFESEVLPLIDDVVPDVLSEPDPVARNARIFRFIEAVMPEVEDSKSDGQAQMNNRDGQTPAGMPDDASKNHSGDAEQALDELDDVEAEDIEKAAEASGDPEPVSDVGLSESAEAEIQADVSAEQQQESGVSDEMLGELENIIDAAGGDELESNEILLPDEEWTGDRDRFSFAQQQSGFLAQKLRNRLQQERKSKVKRNQRRGRFTGRGGAARRAQNGVKDVKEQIEEPEEKDYEFAFVLDRSGSMGGNDIREAEKAMLMLSFALEEVGVETMIVEMYSNEARLSKPFGVPVEQCRDRLAHGQVSGGTPLTESVKLVRERLSRAPENSAVVVVTDGQPADPDRFADVIRGCQMPTIGVNLTSDDDPAGMGEYDRAVATDVRSDLQRNLGQLIEQVMF